MRIAIDIRALVGTKTGIGRLLVNLLTSLNSFADDNEIGLFFNSLRGEIPKGVPDTNKYLIQRTRIPNRLLNVLWAYSSFPKVDSLLKEIDVYYSPNFQAPPASKAARVVTIHDLVFFTNPELAMPAAVRHFKYRIKHYAGRADIITADSNATADDIINHLDVPEEKVKVLYPGTIHINKSSEEEISLLKNKYNLENNFALFVGCLEPRKNLARLLKAYDDSGIYKDIQLVMAGPKGWYFDDLTSVWNSLKCRDRIKWLNYVTDDELAALYNSALFFVYPSLAEGFGLPILEAMSAGCPVMTSNISSMPEVGGDSAYYVDPLQTESITEGLLKISGDSDLRRDLREKGYERIKRFSWDKMSAGLMDILKLAVEKKRTAQNN